MNRRKTTLFWKLKHPGSGCISFLLGTRDRLPAEAFSRLENRLTGLPVRKVWYLIHEFPAETAHCRMPDGITLDHLLSNRHFRRISAILKKTFQVDLETLNHFYPLAVRERLINQIGAQANLTSLRDRLPQILPGAEPVFHSPEDSGYDAIPIPFQLRQLRILASNPARFRLKVEKDLLERNLDDPALIRRNTRERLTGAERKYQSARNAGAADRIIAETRETPGLFLVDAAGLAGGKGILHRLRAAGLQVLPIR